MKKNKNIILLGAALACLCAGCENTFDVSRRADSLLSVAVNSMSEQQSFDVGEKYRAELWVQRGGLADAGGRVRFVVEPALLDSLNEADLTRYELLPADCYEMTKTEFVVNKTECSGYITYDPEKIRARCGYDEVKYVLPLKLVSDDLAVNPERNVALLSFKVSEPIVRILNAGTYEIDPEKNSSLEVVVGVPFTNKWDIRCNLAYDQASVDEYNASNHVHFELLPEEFYVAPENTALAPGVNSLSLAYRLNDNLLPGNYLLPVRIGSIEASLDGVPTDALVADVGSRAVFSVVKLGDKLDKTDWTIIDCNSQNGNSSWSLIDGDEETYWHCQMRNPPPFPVPPFHITIDMQKNIRIAQIDLLSRGQLNSANHIYWVELYGSRDNVEWELIGASDFKDDMTTPTRVRNRYYVKACEARYLKLVIPAGHGNDAAPPAAIRELDVYGKAM